MPNNSYKKVLRMNENGILNKSTTNDMELLTVLVNDQLYGINIEKVQSIQQYDKKLVTTLPEKQSGVTGMFLYRDKTIPLLDLSQILGIELKHEFDQEIIVVTEFNKTVNSFKVQGVKRIYRLSWKNFIPLDPLFNDNSFFTGTVHVEDTQVLILDLEHILTNIFPGTLIEEISKEILNQTTTSNRKQLEIIFAEDSPTMRKAAIKRLKQAGFENISHFINGGTALAYIKSRFKNNTVEKTNNVVLISDIDMPLLDGLSLCHQIKNDPDLKKLYVIMFSSLINGQMIAKCDKAKADACISKPEINELIKILDKKC